MGKKGDLSNFECGRWAVLSISQSAQLGFSQTTISRVYKEWCEHPVCGSPVDKNALLMLEVRGELAD